jgi:serine protease AprX
MLSAVPSYSASNPLPKNGAPSTAKPASVVWGPQKMPTNNTVVLTPSKVLPTVPTDATSAVSSKFSVDLTPQTLTNGSAVSSGVSSMNGDSNRVTVIVQYRQMPTSAHLQTMRDGGAAIKSTLHTIRAVTMRVPVSMLAELAKNPNVAYITPDRRVSMTTNNEDYSAAVEADVAAAQFALDGTGVGVAVIDSGVADHADLHNVSGASRVVYSQSFVAGDTTTADKFGHGTHVAGLIGGTGASSGTGNGYAVKFAGVAPNVNIINLRVLDQNGSGTDSQVIAAIQQAIALKSTYNIRVINMSLGRPVFESYTLDPVDQAVEAAWKAGIVVVVAAGNNGRDNSMGTHGFATIGVPGNDPAVITVGATRTNGTSTRADDSIASYSSKGPTLVDHLVKPDLVAPGNRLVSLRVASSTLDKSYPGFEVGPASGPAKYFRLSGTSMATPLVSGAVALMLQKNSALTPDQVKARLMKTAWKGFAQYTSSVDDLGNTYSNQYDIFTYGAGHLDVAAALNNTDLASGVALSPTAVYNATTKSVSLVNTTSVVWGSTSVVWGATSVVWGNSVVWGATTITSNSVVWGSTSVVWGSTSVSGFSVVWGATSTIASPMAAFSDGDDGEN